MNASERTAQEWALLEARVKELESQLGHAAREVMHEQLENQRLRYELTVTRGAVVVLTKTEMRRRAG